LFIGLIANDSGCGLIIPQIDRCQNHQCVILRSEVECHCARFVNDNSCQPLSIKTARVNNASDWLPARQAAIAAAHVVCGGVFGDI
jgi:hypothetical protein